MKVVDKPWGHELIWAHTDNYVGKIIHVKKGHRLSLQYHEEKEETLLITKGLADVEVHSKDGKVVIFHLDTSDYANNVVHIPPKMIHRIVAIEDSDIVEVSTTQLDDVVRLEDDYNR